MRRYLFTWKASSMINQGTLPYRVPMERTPFSLGEELQTLALGGRFHFLLGRERVCRVPLGTEQLLALLAMSIGNL